MRRLLIMLLLLLPPLAVAEEGGPEAIEIPDIRANIIKMLQQTGERPTTSGVTPSEPAPQQPPAADDLFEQARRQMEQSSQQDKPAAEPTVSAPESPSEPAEPSVSEEPRQSYVPLPSKQITIEDLDDLEELQWEIDEAKKRQREQQ